MPKSFPNTLPARALAFSKVRKVCQDVCDESFINNIEFESLAIESLLNNVAPAYYGDTDRSLDYDDIRDMVFKRFDRIKAEWIAFDALKKAEQKLWYNHIHKPEYGKAVEFANEAERDT